MAPFLYATVVFAALALAACSTARMQQADSLCLGCIKLTLSSDTDIPVSAYTSLTDDGRNGYLHVYLEGDGTPWRGYRPSRNPTSTSLVALHLMQLDQNSSVYLNRPCYGTTDTPPGCQSRLWTQQRYSEDIVSRMDRALDEIVAASGASKLLLFGYSGGGTLAMLLAQQREDVIGLVTVAANLDHRLWTGIRRFTPLDGSLNPADFPPLPADVFRLHLAGGRDHQVPAGVVEQVAGRDPHAHYRLYPEFDHRCCWSEVWPEVLAEVRRELEDRR